MQTLKLSQKLSLAAALLIVILAPLMGYLKLGLPPVMIIGGSALVGFVFWYKTYLRKPAEPAIILPLFVLTVAGLQIHIVEEYLTGFGPAMSRLFSIPWTESSFVMVFALIGPTIYTLTTLGLYYKMPLAGFVAWFIFIGPGVAEFTHFIFPLLEPVIAPDNIAEVSQLIRGIEVTNMPNYYHKTTGHYYFSGMYTAALPMIPGMYAIVRLVREHRKTRLDKSIG
jgi:hypothetical protein